MRGMLRDQRGFSLIELLVVTAIIGVLAAILLPVMHAARERGRTVRCQNNLRQIGLALQQYANDFDGFLPHEDDRQDNPPDYVICWYYVIDPYLETGDFGDIEVSEVKLCPALPKDKINRTDGYKMNRGLENIGTGFYLKIDTVPRPSATVCIFDGQTGGPHLTFKGKAESFSRRHHKGANILFLDWHVKWYSRQYVISDARSATPKIIWEFEGGSDQEN